jgi:hypothetical protein
LYALPERLCHNILSENLRLLVLEGKVTLTLSLLMSNIYGAPSKARNLSHIYVDGTFYWGFCFLNRAFRNYMREKPTNTPIIHSVY